MVKKYLKNMTMRPLNMSTVNKAGMITGTFGAVLTIMFLEGLKIESKLIVFGLPIILMLMIHPQLKETIMKIKQKK